MQKIKKNIIQIQSHPQRFDSEFINLINALNESIKEYYSVCQNNIKETDTFLNLFDPQWNSINTLLYQISNQNINQNKEKIAQNITQCQNIVNQLKSNSLYNHKNLRLFFDDAKVLFQKMRAKRKEDLDQIRRSLTARKKDLLNNNINMNDSFSLKSGIFQTDKKKLVQYLRQLKDYEEIIGKFSEKAKYNFINLQKLILNILSEKYIPNLNYPKSTSNSAAIRIQENNDFNNNAELRNKYMNEITRLNNKLKELELEKNNRNDLSVVNKAKKFDELKRIFEKNLIAGNNNNINLLQDIDFEKKILYVIESNKNLNNEINKLKINLINSDNNNIQLKQDLLSKEKEIMILTNNKNINNNNKLNISEKTVLNKKKYENYIDTLNQKIENLSKNLTSKNAAIIDLQRENISLKSLINDSTMNNSLMNNNIDNIKMNNLKLSEENKNLKLMLTQANLENNQINSHLQVMGMNNGYITSMQQELNQLKKIIDENNITNNKKNLEYQEQINNLQNMLKTKDALLKQYEDKNNNHENIKNLINEINNKDKTINELKNIINNNDIKNKQIFEKYNAEKNLLNNQILLLNQNLKDINNNSNSNNYINSLKNKIIELNNVINKLRNENINLENEYKIKINEKENEIFIYKEKLEDVIKQTQMSKEKDINSGNTVELAIKSENQKSLINNSNNQELELLRQQNKNLEFNLNQLNQKLSNLANQNETNIKEKDLLQQTNKELMSQNAMINQKNSELLQQLNTTSLNQYSARDNNNLLELQRKQEEIEGLKTFISKLTKESEQAKEDIANYKQKLNSLQKENTSIKNQLERLAVEMPKELNALQRQLANKNNQMNINNNDNNINNIISKKNKEISELKDKNKQLQFKLEEKEAKAEFERYKTEDMDLPNYEEEFDLRKMASGARAKNRSEDLNIDYPGIQSIKDRLKEVQFKLKNLEEQVKILLSKVKCNDKIKPAFVQICQLLGYDSTTIDKICNSEKEKKKIFGI